MSKPSPKPKRVLAMPSDAQNREILAAIEADSGVKPLPHAQLNAMDPLISLRGRPPLENKKQFVSVRYSPEVLAYFRNTDTGWQARMDEVLQDYVAKGAD